MTFYRELDGSQQTGPGILRRGPRNYYWELLGRTDEPIGISAKGGLLCAGSICFVRSIDSGRL